MAADLSPAEEAGGILTIDVDAIAENWRRLAARVERSECAAAVKADAYGTGIETTVPALAGAGCRSFFVAHPAEGRRVRAAAPEATVYVLNGLKPGCAALYAEAGLRPVLGSREEVEEWGAFRRATGWSGGEALQVDTGMSRLGIPREEAAAVAASGAGFSLVMSHLACADEPEHPQNRRQIDAFRHITSLFPGVPASLSNSSGLFLDDDIGFALARPGYALYGGNPTPGRPNPMRRAVSLQARIIQLREVAAGTAVGYGATWTAPRPSRLAVLDLGYADGFLRAGSSSASIAIGGVRCPVVGRISMDLTIADVSHLPAGEAARGMWAEIIGDTVTLDEVGRASGTIGYEILTALGRRYARRVVGVDVAWRPPTPPPRTPPLKGEEGL